MQEKRNASDGSRLDADLAQAVEHRLPRLERHLIGFPAAARPSLPRQIFSVAISLIARRPRRRIWTARALTRPPAQRTTWLTRHSGSMSGRSSRWCAPRLSRAGERRLRDGARDEQHVAQVEPVEPAACRMPRRRRAAARRARASARRWPPARARAVVACATARHRRPSIGLQRCDHRGGVRRLLRRRRPVIRSSAARAARCDRDGLAALGPRARRRCVRPGGRTPAPR